MTNQKFKSGLKIEKILFVYKQINDVSLSLDFKYQDKLHKPKTLN